MKTMKTIIMVAIIMAILTMSCLAISIKEWELKKLEDRYENEATRVAIVMENQDGEIQILEIDTVNGIISCTEIDEDGDATIDSQTFGEAECASIRILY